MAKEQQHGEVWGTLEELLLACAVNRHGTKSWDSIAMEVQNRTSIFPSPLTSQHCIEKFNDLKRRFRPPRSGAGASSTASLAPIIDELRKIRVEELRREVQRRDVSISSLESKVKKLEEDRDRSVKEETDLVGEKKSVTGKTTTAGEDSGDERENRSFNESNSTDQQKAEATTARVQNDDVDDELTAQPDPHVKIENEPVRSESDPRSGRDWSCNGKSEDVEEDDGNGKIERDDKKEPGLKLSQTTGGLGESNELGESVGESKREEKEKEKQNSDVQSSASLSLKTKKRRHRGIAVGGGRRRVGSSSGDSGLGAASSSGEEPELEPEGGYDVSPATKRVKAAAVKSELMSKLMETIRSHRLRSVFQQRLRSQETQKYKNLIRQHIDFQTIQSRLDKGVYSSSIQKFFRDLLLLFNNGVVFFRKNSPENTAACELRVLVLKEMTKKLGKKRKPETTRSERETKPPPQQPTSFSKLTKSTSTIVVCAGKGNSAKTAGNSAKTTASESVSKKGNSGDKKEKEVEEKPKANVKKIEGESFPRIEEKGTRKKRRKDQRSASSNGRNNSNKNAETKHKYGGNELSSHDALEMVEKKGNNNTTTSKRQGAASFLKRMKQNSPSQATGNEDGGGGSSSSSSSEEEEVVEEEETSKEIKVKVDGKGQKGRNREVITERVTRSLRGRSEREESARGKRAVGRPPKKESPKSTGSGKRVRENGGSDIGGGGGGGSGRARKRSRR